MIKALIFDFDGLILDTEVPEYQSWADLYQAYGCSLPLEKWANALTRQLSLGRADLQMNSLGDFPLVQLLQRAGDMYENTN
jgi:beta-phosphoglucomutase-like phosphatase (HAD superfamily)